MANYRVRRMRRKDVDLAIEWAAAEGWNPGLNDAGLFYDTDPQGFFIGELDGDPVGSLSGVSYGAAFGFMGLYIVRPKFRGHNYGLQLWHEVMKYLGARNVGLDGVPEQQSNYMKSGFTLAYRNVRYEGVGNNAGDAAPETVPLTSVDLTQLVACDAQVFPAPRADFVRRWNAQAGAHGRALLRDGQLAGYAVMRPCRRGYKIGPLTASDEATAEALFNALSAQAPGEPVFLDVPEVNPRAVALARRHGMKPAFETARMYNRQIPSLPLERIYGVCTFELG